jgi:tetratricopeptide (TPR) repeat protein
VRSQVYLERHDFKRAAENSERLIARYPQDPYNYGVLGDALIEQGQYEKAADAYQKMVNLRPDLSSYNRASYYRYLLGDAKGAIEVMKAAVNAGSPSMPESIAWCLVQLGNMQFQQGRLAEAEKSYTEALSVFPNHYEALAGLGKVAAARDKIEDAIAYMKKSVAVVPFLDNVALLADYFELAGKKAQAGEQWKLVEFIDRLAEINKEVFNRNLALAYANHDMQPEKALQLALRELDARGDIYTWDAAAWAYYKDKKYKEASEAITKAMQLGTPDPMLHYHAGMIARASGRNAQAKMELARALELNPRFDAKQSRVAATALQSLTEEQAAGGGQ